MNKVSLVLLAAVALSFAARGDTVTLKPDAYVTGPKILLGEIAEIEGDHRALLSKVEICSAPQPGVSKRVDAGLLTSRIARLGLEAGEVEVKGPHSITVTTLHLEITREMVEEELRRFIEKQMPWSPADAVVDVIVPSRTVVVPDGDVSIRWRLNPPYRLVGSGTIRGDILVDGRVRQTIHCRADVDAYVDVFVASRKIARGNSLSPGDLRVEKRAYSSLRADPIVSQEQLAGHVARASIFPGEIITERNIQLRRLIRRNQIVRVEVVSGSLRVQGRARALADGVAGDEILCENPSSKERFQGIVRKDGVVIIP